MPLHLQKNAMGWGYRHIAVSCLNIKFGHEGPCTKLGDQMDHLIECDVMEGVFFWVNPIVDNSPARGGKVHDEVPLPWLASF